MRRENICRLKIITAAILWLVSVAAQASDGTLSQQLLRSYFNAAAVCTTSQISDIRDTGETVTIEIVIEPKTRMALPKMQQADRDDWFSLHCPPEIHGVWRQPQPPKDILVTGLIGDDVPNTLSCVDYLRTRWESRELTIRDKIQRWLDKKLEARQATEPR